MFDSLKRYLMRKKTQIIFEKERTEPLCRNFGVERGKPLDRYYIEKFLNSRSALIRGSILEISENTYTRKYGSDVSKSTVLTFDKTASAPSIYGDLTNQCTLPAEKFDCFIATQTLNFIRDVDMAVANAAHLLVSGGVFLGTVAALSPVSRFDYERWGDYWRFTDMGIKVLLEKHFSGVKIYPYGNFSAARYFLDGVVLEDIPSKEILDKKDEDFSIVIGFEAYKS